MEYRGTVRSSVIVLAGGTDLPDGTPVRVTADEAPARAPETEAAAAPPGAGTLGERLLRFAGAVKGLPADMARNHDHYIHGTPRE